MHRYTETLKSLEHLPIMQQLQKLQKSDIGKTLETLPATAMGEAMMRAAERAANPVPMPDGLDIVRQRLESWGAR